MVKTGTWSGLACLKCKLPRLSGQLGQDLQALEPYASRSRAGLWAAVLGAEAAAGTAWAALRCALGAASISRSHKLQ